MDDLDGALVSVRGDTQGFAREVQAMRDTLEGSLGTGAERAGRAIETSLLRAVRSGKLGFDDLKRVALAALGEIAAGALRGGLDSVLGGGGLSGVLGALVGGQPGRATGGPVTPGRAYRVGERGPELFVPTASGRVEAGGGSGSREVRGGDHGSRRLWGGAGGAAAVVAAGGSGGAGGFAGRVSSREGAKTRRREEKVGSGEAQRRGDIVLVRQCRVATAVCVVSPCGLGRLKRRRYHPSSSPRLRASA